MSARQRTGAETGGRCLSMKACAASWIGLSMGAWVLIGAVTYVVRSASF